jgi:hypothetical protein
MIYYESTSVSVFFLSAGFVQITLDTTWVQQSLASNVSRFLAENSHLVPPNANLGFVWNGTVGIEKAMSGIADSEDWKATCMYVRRISSQGDASSDIQVLTRETTE